MFMRLIFNWKRKGREIEFKHDSRGFSSGPFYYLGFDHLHEALKIQFQYFDGQQVRHLTLEMPPAAAEELVKYLENSKASRAKEKQQAEERRNFYARNIREKGK